MTQNAAGSMTAEQRTLYFLTHPEHWPFWPFLPLVRRRPGEDEELGVLYDALHARSLPGLSCMVFKCNLFLLPPAWEDFLALPHETHDTPEEVVAAGWMVD